MQACCIASARPQAQLGRHPQQQAVIRPVPHRQTAARQTCTVSACLSSSCPSTFPSTPCLSCAGAGGAAAAPAEAARRARQRRHGAQTRGQAWAWGENTQCFHTKVPVSRHDATTLSTLAQRSASCGRVRGCERAVEPCAQLAKSPACQCMRAVSHAAGRTAGPWASSRARCHGRAGSTMMPGRPTPPAAGSESGLVWASATAAWVWASVGLRDRGRAPKTAPLSPEFVWI